MEKKRIEKNIEILKRNIDYYTRVYGPNLAKIDEAKKKLAEMTELLEGMK